MIGPVISELVEAVTLFVVRYTCWAPAQCSGALAQSNIVDVWTLNAEGG